LLYCTGGVAYVLDEHHHLYKRLNKELVECTEVTQQSDIDTLRNLIAEHVSATGSENGENILTHFDKYLPLFKKVIPHDYRIVTEAIAVNEQNGMDEEQAKIEAFHKLINAE